MGSENTAPGTLVQLCCKLNQLLWTGTGILIPISVSCGEMRFNFQRTLGTEPIHSRAVPTQWKNPFAVIKFDCNDLVLFLDIMSFSLYPQGMEF